MSDSSESWTFVDAILIICGIWAVYLGYGDRNWLLIAIAAALVVQSVAFLGYRRGYVTS